MIELRIHGRGGQGAVVASKALAQAAFLQGHYVQSYPDYGVERRGAPVVAFARIAEEDDRYFVRQDIREPHHLLILDATLLDSANPLAGLRPNGSRGLERVGRRRSPGGGSAEREPRRSDPRC